MAKRMGSLLLTIFEIAALAGIWIFLSREVPLCHVHWPYGLGHRDVLSLAFSFAFSAFSGVQSLLMLVIKKHAIWGAVAYFAGAFYGVMAIIKDRIWMGMVITLNAGLMSQVVVWGGLPKLSNVSEIVGVLGGILGAAAGPTILAEILVAMVVAGSVKNIAGALGLGRQSKSIHGGSRYG